MNENAKPRIFQKQHQLLTQYFENSQFNILTKQEAELVNIVSYCKKVVEILPMEVRTYLVSLYNSQVGTAPNLPSAIYHQGDFPVNNRSNHKRKPNCHHKLADKPGSSQSQSGKPEPREKIPPITISKTILLSLVLGGIAITAITCNFNGLIEIKLGLEGAQVLIDGRQPLLLPPTTK